MEKVEKPGKSTFSSTNQAVKDMKKPDIRTLAVYNRSNSIFITREK